jgi:hypothetical protein
MSVELSSVSRRVIEFHLTLCGRMRCVAHSMIEKCDGSFSGFTSHPVEISAFFNAYNFTTTKHNKLFKEEHPSIAVYAAYIFLLKILAGWKILL